jgi:hypothetical protein
LPDHSIDGILFLNRVFLALDGPVCQSLRPVFALLATPGSGLSHVRASTSS